VGWLMDNSIREESFEEGVSWALEQLLKEYYDFRSQDIISILEVRAKLETRMVHWPHEPNWKGRR